MSVKAVVPIAALAPSNRITDNGGEPTKTLRVAIVGTASGFEQAPYADPSWEIWGLSRGYLSVPRWTRWFELHKPEEICKTWSPGDEAAEQAARTAYTGWLEKAHSKGKVYSREAAIANTEAFPFDELVAAFPRGYFTNSVAWMIAYAIEQGATEIGLWGVDMALDTEFGAQRPSCEYFLGIAEGRGITVSVSAMSDLLKTRTMYAYEDHEAFTYKMRLKVLEMEQHKAGIMKEMDQARMLLAAKEGALDAFQYVQRCWGEEG